MRKNMEISSEQFNAIINDFYNYFENGYVFEEFLKSYLEKIGLDEVFVTKRSDDGGIDLTATRKGIGEFDQSDSDKYYIQAKRNKPTSNISPEKIRALRGSFTNGKGIFITTARVSDKAKSDANSLDPQRPIIVVDGKDLVISCIENEIGFVFNPQFSESAMREFISINRPTQTDNQLENSVEVEKAISTNDIRARILRIPRPILDELDVSCSEYEVHINNDYSKKMKIDKSRTYFAGVSEIYKRLDLLASDGSFHTANATWTFHSGQLSIKIELIK
jgi:restriction system protein